MTRGPEPFTTHIHHAPMPVCEVSLWLWVGAHGIAVGEDFHLGHVFFDDFIWAIYVR
jgi:hypothetical protein